MGTRCLLKNIQDRLSLHHGIIMMRLVTGFFLSVLQTIFSQNSVFYPKSLKGAPLCFE